ALLVRERGLQQKLNAKAEARAKLLNGPHTETRAAAIETELNALTIELQQIQTQIRQASPRYAALMQPQPLTADEIQQQLDDDSLLLEYSLGDQRSFLWAVTPKTVTSYELPNRKVIEAAAQNIYDLLTSPKRSPRGETEQERGVRQVQANKQYPIA